MQTGQAAFLTTEQSSLVCNVTIGVDGRGSEKVGWETLQWQVLCPNIFSPQIYRQKSQVGVASTHSLSGMYVLTSIAELETTGDSCVDRLARNPDHGIDPETKKLGTCLVGRRLGDDWRCGGGGLAAEGSGRGGLASSAGANMGEVQEMEGEEAAVMVRLPKNYQVTGPTVWKEPKLMSPWAARPLFLPRD